VQCLPAAVEGIQHLKPNIVILAVDSLRADHLGCYGYSRQTSPNIDRIAKEGVLGENFFCSALPTHPSFTSLYTGQHPIRHNIVSHGGAAKLATDTPLLAQLALRNGYTTCAVDNLMRERLWFGRGYEFYIDPGQRRTLSLCVTAEELNRRAIPWIREHREEPFFLFMHYWDPHAPYNAPEKYRDLFYQGEAYNPANRSLETFWSTPMGALARDTWLSSDSGVITDAVYVEAMYDQEIRHVDEGIGELVSTIDDCGLGENTIIAIIGDHGESMTEHDIFFDHYGLYEPTLQIPLIVRAPGRLPAGSRLPFLLQNHDLTPTLLEGAGIMPPRTMDGQSFWKLLTGETSQGGREEIICCECTMQAQWCLRTRDHKFIVSREQDIDRPARELYDLRSDPKEERNIVEEQPQLASEMERRLESWIADQLRQLRRTQDPLIQQGMSMKNILDQWKKQGAANERTAPASA
jgi:arylsulfatase A-like enzyme